MTPTPLPAPTRSPVFTRRPAGQALGGRAGPRGTGGRCVAAVERDGAPRGGARGVLVGRGQGSGGTGCPQALRSHAPRGSSREGVPLGLRGCGAIHAARPQELPRTERRRGPRPPSSLPGQGRLSSEGGRREETASSRSEPGVLTALQPGPSKFRIHGTACLRFPVVKGEVVTRLPPGVAEMCDVGGKCQRKLLCPP